MAVEDVVPEEPFSFFKATKESTGYDPDEANFERVVDGEFTPEAEEVAYSSDMETTAPPPTADIDLPPSRELTAQDRCDRCGAQALVVAEKGKLEVLLCNHHGEKHQAKLLEDGWTWTKVSS